MKWIYLRVWFMRYLHANIREILQQFAKYGINTPNNSKEPPLLPRNNKRNTRVNINK